MKEHQDKIIKQIGLLSEKKGGIIGVIVINDILNNKDAPKDLIEFLKEIGNDYGRQIEFLKSLLTD